MLVYRDNQFTKHPKPELGLEWHVIDWVKYLVASYYWWVYSIFINYNDWLGSNTWWPLIIDGMYSIYSLTLFICTNTFELRFKWLKLDLKLSNVSPSLRETCREMCDSCICKWQMILSRFCVITLLSLYSNFFDGENPVKFIKKIA